MSVVSLIALVLVAVAGASAEPPPGTCSLVPIVTHGDPARTHVYAASTGEPAVYFRAKLAVNTDGASRSYHPDDPRGKTKALNNVANAISHIYDADGDRIDCDPRRGACFERYITTFEAARDADWNPTGHPRVETEGMIPWRQDAARGRRVPCTIPSGRFQGYFVSATAFHVDETKGECDQDRYLDSLAFDAIVLPRHTAWESQGHVADKGDLVAVCNTKTGTIVFAIVGDRGPADDLGEGTVALAAALRGTTLTGDETYEAVRRLALDGVEYVVFPAASIRDATHGPFTQADVDRAAREAFERWGGTARLDACRTLAR